MPEDHDHPAASPRAGLRRAAHDRGAGLVEYALLLALIALVCFGSLQAFGVTNGGSINESTSSYVSAVN